MNGIGVIKLGPVTGPTATAEPAESAASSIRERKVASTAEAQVDPVTQQPIPLRFPWLSRLTSQLETASKQRAPFPPAPELGDHVDQSV